MSVRNADGVRKVARGGKPHWVIDFSFRNLDGRTQRYRRDAVVQTSAGAHAEAQRLRVYAVAHGTLDAPKRSPIFKAFVEGDFGALFMPKYRPATRVRYEALLRQGLMESFGSSHLDDVDAASIRAYAAKLAAKGVQGRGPLNLLRTVMKAAVEIGALSSMPQFPSTKPSKKLPDAPSVDEVSKMLGLGRGWLRVAIALAAYAGLRSGEVRALEVRDVDLENGVINVRRAMSEDEVTTPKGCHERVVPLAPELRALLVETMHDKLPRARVVVNGEGKTPTRQAVLTRLRALQTAHELRPRSFHALRHFFASVLIRHGASVEAVRLLVGHTSLATTQRYVHASAGDLRQAIARSFGN